MGMRVEPTVKLVNRLVDDDGTKIPQDFMYDGEGIEIVDEISVPWGIARVIAHHSMRKLDLTTMRGELYTLGCKEFGLPTEPLKASELAESNELIARNLMAHRNKVKSVRIHNPILRNEPLSVQFPGKEDGAFPGGYGNVPEQGMKA